MDVSKIRKVWACEVGKSSNLVVELHVEASIPKSADPACHVRGHIGVPSLPKNDEERYHLARVLLGKTVLPALRPDLSIRILDITAKQISKQKLTVEVKSISMPRFMHWEKEYIENPYMRALPMEDLNQRFFDIIVNSHEINEGGKLGIGVGANGTMWLRFFQHVLMEAKMRELPYPYFLDKRYSLDWDEDSFISSVKGKHSSSAYDACTKWMEEKNNKFHVVKYGEYRYMKRFLKEGQMLIQPSDNFDDESYNQAVRDDENAISIFGARINSNEAIPAHDIRGWGDRYSMAGLSSSMDRSYMMYCMTRILSPTLFSHFGPYDSCVLIHDMGEFVKRLDEGTSRYFPTEGFVHARGNVTYIDPLGAIKFTANVQKKTNMIIPFLKHFRHSYQDEYRFVWVPRTPKKHGLTKVNVSIGSLEDIAEIIRI